MKAVRGLVVGLLLVLVAVGATARDELPTPNNVTLWTMNTHYLLRWNWGPWTQQTHTDDYNITYTMQYIAKYKLRRSQQEWTTVCMNSTHTECDLTNEELNYLGIYVLRVCATAQTNSHTLQSAWVNVTFCPDSNASLGPPSNVVVSSHGRGLLEVKIDDPVTHNNQTMRNNVPKLYFLIQFWGPDKKVQVVKSAVGLVTLSDVEESVLVCVRVQTCADFYNKTSAFTQPQCTHTQGQTPYWQVALYFLLALVFAFAFFVAVGYGSFLCWRSIKTTWFPGNQLPVHIQQYLQEACADKPRLLNPESESTLLIGRLDICTQLEDVTTLVTLETNPEAGPVLHSHHGSADSGVVLCEDEGSQQGGVALEGGVALVEQQVWKEQKGRIQEEDEGVLDMTV